jgi:hypothetical protein
VPAVAVVALASSPDASCAPRAWCREGSGQGAGRGSDAQQARSEAGARGSGRAGRLSGVARAAGDAGEPRARRFVGRIVRERSMVHVGANAAWRWRGSARCGRVLARCVDVRSQSCCGRSTDGGVVCVAMCARSSSEVAMTDVRWTCVCVLCRVARIRMIRRNVHTVRCCATCRINARARNCRAWPHT